MPLFGRDYDRDYGRDFDPGANTSGRWNRGGYRGGPYGGTDRNWAAADDRAYYDSARRHTEHGYDRGYRSLGYDRGYADDRSAGGRGYDSGYAANYKSRWQTDHGDPFGDRSSGTPMRVIRGSFEDQYGQDYRDRGDRSGWLGGGERGEDGGWARSRSRGTRYGREYGYGRDYSGNPMGYDPYSSRESSMERGWGMRDMDRRYRYGSDFRNEWY